MAEFEALCVDCKKPLRGVHQNRVERNPARRCMDCYKKTLKYRTTQGEGYIIVTLPDGRKELEHRIVMEEMLGRPLEKGEVVHHINELRSDNRRENLRLHQNVGVHIQAEHSHPAKRPWEDLGISATTFYRRGMRVKTCPEADSFRKRKGEA